MPESNILEQLISSITQPPRTIGPNLGKVLGTNAGGILGSGIGVSDAIAAALGALLTRNLPQSQAINTTLGLATLPGRARAARTQRLTQGAQVAATLQKLKTARQQQRRLTAEEERKAETFGRERKVRAGIITQLGLRGQQGTLGSIQEAIAEGVRFSKAELELLVPQVAQELNGLGVSMDLLKELPSKVRAILIGAAQASEPMTVIGAIDLAKQNVIEVDRLKVEAEAIARVEAPLKNKVSLSTAVQLRRITQDKEANIILRKTVDGRLRRSIDAAVAAFSGQTKLFGTIKSIIIQSDFLRTVTDVANAEGLISGLEITEEDKVLIQTLLQNIRGLRAFADEERLAVAERAEVKRVIGMSGINTPEELIGRLITTQQQIAREQNLVFSTLPRMLNNPKELSVDVSAFVIEPRSRIKTLLQLRKKRLVVTPPPLSPDDIVDVIVPPAR